MVKDFKTSGQILSLYRFYNQQHVATTLNALRFHIHLCIVEINLNIIFCLFVLKNFLTKRIKEIFIKLVYKKCLEML